MSAEDAHPAEGPRLLFPASAAPFVITRRILFREFLLALIPAVAFVAVLAAGNLVYLDYVHVLTGGTWTGIDLFMGLVMSRVIRSLTVPQRAEVAKRLTPRTLFLLPSLAGTAVTSGIYLAMAEGRFLLSDPWILAAGIVVLVLLVQGLGMLLPNNVRILLEIQKPVPNVERIVRLNRRNLLLAGSQAAFQFAIIFIMAHLAMI